MTRKTPSAAMTLLLALCVSVFAAKACGDAPAADLTIESVPTSARVFVRTGGHNGYAEVGKTPITLKDVAPGLLEYTLLRTDRQMHDGSLWIEPAKEHVDKVEMKPGRVFFAVPGGNDKNPGTEAKPWKTLKKACDALEAGDTVLVKAGRYVDPQARWDKAFTPARSGAPGKPITFRAFPGEKVILGMGTGSSMRPQSRSYIVIDGFFVDGSVGFHGCDHCTVRNCEATKGRAAGATGGVLNWAVFVHGCRYCVIENCYVHDMLAKPPTSHNAACIMNFCSSDCVIQNNVAHAGGGLIYNAFGQKGGHIFANTWRWNVARDAKCGFLGMAATAEDQSSGDNIYYQNVCVNCTTAFGWSHMCSGYRVFNNTIYSGSSFVGAGDRCTRNRVWNNITTVRLGYSTGMWPIEKVFDACDFNLLNSKEAARQSWRPYAATLADWQRKIGLDKHSLPDDPRFRDAEAQDFRLRKDSPCIDRGRPLSVAVGAGDNADVLTIRNDGHYTKHVRKDPTKHGGAPPTQQPLRMPFLVGDLIQIGKGANTRRTTVVEILDNKRLMLDRKVSWKDGDWVTFPFKGDAPDIGAYEFGDERVIIGPTWKHYPKREFKVVRQE